MKLPAYYVTDDTFSCVGSPKSDVRKAMCAWLRQHSIDPDHVSDQGVIERRVEKRQVRYIGWEFDEDGAPKVTPDGDDIEWRVRTVQLEAAPAPWPDIVSRKAVRP